MHPKGGGRGAGLASAHDAKSAGRPHAAFTRVQSGCAPVAPSQITHSLLRRARKRRLMVGLFLGADGLVHTVQPAAREVDMQPREHLDPAAVRCRAAKLTSFPGSGMPRHPKRDPLRDAKGAHRNVIAKIGRLSLRNRTLRSESHTRAVRYRIVRGLASADALQATAFVACAELDRIG